MIQSSFPLQPPMAMLQLRNPFLALMHIKLIFVSGLHMPDPLLFQFRCYLLTVAFLELLIYINSH